MKYLILVSLSILAVPILYASAEPAFVYSEQITRTDSTINVCYQIIDINANPLSGVGLVLSLTGKENQEQTVATDVDGITTAAFTIKNTGTMTLKISKILGNNTYSSNQETRITAYDSGITSEPKTQKITLAAKPKIKTSCVDKTPTAWEIWDQDEKTTTYFDLNTWTTVKTDKTSVLKITQAGKTVNAKISLGTWQKDIDSVLVKNGFAPTSNPGTIQKVTVDSTLKKSIQTKLAAKKDTKAETKKESVKKVAPIKAKQIKVKRGQTIIEKITGNIQMGLYQKGQTADVSILKPDGTTEMQQIAVSSKGKFEHPFSITDKTKPGKYEITISYSGKEVKKASYEIKLQ